MGLLKTSGVKEMKSVATTEELLMMFIKDGYSASGKVSKSTATAMMRYVANDGRLQGVINNGDGKDILSYRKLTTK